MFFALAIFTGRACGCACAACPRMQHASVCFDGRAMRWWPGRNEFDLHLLAGAERRSRRSLRYLAPRELLQSRVRHLAAACAEGHPHQCNASMITLAAVKTPGSSSALLATQGAHAHILDAQGFAHLRDALICGRAQGSACLRRLPNGRPSVDHTSQPCTTSCRTVLRRRNAKNARLLVRPAGVCRTMRARCVLAQTDACPDSSSAARNSSPMGLDNVGAASGALVNPPFRSPFKPVHHTLARPVHRWGSLMGTFTVHRSGLQNGTEFGPVHRTGGSYN